jgi:hypothetical protein
MRAVLVVLVGIRTLLTQPHELVLRHLSPGPAFVVAAWVQRGSTEPVSTYSDSLLSD